MGVVSSWWLRPILMAPDLDKRFNENKNGVN